MRRLLALVTALGATAGMAQQPPPAEGARELFFAGAAPKDELPPVRQSAPAKAAPATVPPASQPGRATSGSAAALGAVHLGLRYNLLLVSARGDRGPAGGSGSQLPQRRLRGRRAGGEPVRVSVCAVETVERRLGSAFSHAGTVGSEQSDRPRPDRSDAEARLL